MSTMIFTHCAETQRDHSVHFVTQVHRLRRVPGSEGDKGERERPIRSTHSQQPCALPHRCPCAAAGARVRNYIWATGDSINQ